LNRSLSPSGNGFYTHPPFDEEMTGLVIAAFQAAERADPTCAMAYWGTALVFRPRINFPHSSPSVAERVEGTRTSPRKRVTRLAMENDWILLARHSFGAALMQESSLCRSRTGVSRRPLPVAGERLVALRSRAEPPPPFWAQWRTTRSTRSEPIVAECA